MKKHAVLIVEDEAAIADTLIYALSTDGFEPVWVASGEEAIARIRGGEFQFVVLDIGLPDINGFDLFRQLRSISHIPTLFLTARDAEIDRIVGLEIGADDYVTKPFSPREVVARIKAILRRAAPTEPDAKINSATETTDTKHRLRIDEKLACAYVRDQPLCLTRSEYLLLKHLLQHTGHVFSRTQLMNAIWDETHPSDERAIDTHIKTLRAKLKAADSNDQSIQTHRGLGYSLLNAAIDSSVTAPNSTPKVEPQ